MDEEDGRTGPEARKYGAIDVLRDASTGSLCRTGHLTTNEDLRGRRDARAACRLSGTMQRTMESNRGLRGAENKHLSARGTAEAVPFQNMGLQGVCPQAVEPFPFKTISAMDLSAGCKDRLHSGACMARLKGLRKKAEVEQESKENMPQGLKAGGFYGTYGPTEVGPFQNRGFDGVFPQRVRPRSETDLRHQ